MEGREAEVKTGHGKGEREKTYDEWLVNMLGSQHSTAMAGRVGVGGPSQPVAGRGEKGQGASPLQHASDFT